MDKYQYLKEGETTPSSRILHDVTKPGNISALDLSGLSDEAANKALRTYEDWKTNHQKPYSAKEREFRKENLLAWEDYAKQQGIETPPMVKSFKPQGLTKVI